MSGESTRQKTVNRPAAVTPAAAAPVQVQTFSNKVSSPKDPAEKEAESAAKKVMRMAQPPSVARFAGSIQRKGDGQPAVSAGAAAEIRSSMAGGSPLPPGVRGFMEPRFRADFSNVKVHTGEKAARLSAGLNAQAFTVGNHVFFGRDRFRPESGEGRELIAHELTHTIQQGSVIQRSEDVSVTQSSPAQVQRLGVSDALDYFADKANLIPGFRMFTIVLGVNPINMSRVERNAANILRAAVEFIPGGALITRALDNYGVFDRVGNWVEEQIRSLGMTGAAIRQAVMEFIDSLSWSDIFDLGGVWERAKRIFSVPIDRIRNFLVSLGSGILRFIREAILRPLGALAARTQAWDLLRAVLGQDPVTGDPYPRNADTLIGGFMKLIGQEEVWNNLKRANAVARAWAWFQSALSELIGFVREIPGLFLQALQALQIDDLVDLPGAFARVGRVFSNFVGRFVSWGLAKVLNLLEIIFEVLAPSVVPYIRKAAGAFRTIIQNPIGFIGNLVRAGIQGFRQFGTNFLSHLRASLIGWLTGTLSGANIYIPQAFTLREIIKFVLSVLGLTWQNLRQKLVRAVGETAVRAMETGFDIVMTLVTQGPAAAWEKIQESLSNLRDMVMEQIMTFVRDRVVQAAITRLVTSLNPAGAFIQAIIAIYNTIMFFVERLRQIAQVAAAFIDSISAIASGVISAAANRVEQTMAGLLTLVISFLARIAGLGRVSDAVTNIVSRVRSPIDRAMDRVVDWVVAQARRLGRFVAQAGVPQDPNERLRLAAQAAVGAARRLRGRVTMPLLTPLLAGIRTRYGLNTIEPYEQAGRWWVRASINPIINQNLDVPSGLVGPDGRTPLAQYERSGGEARTPEGANYRPLIGKLTQAVQMFTVWARRESTPVAQQMLRHLEAAREQAQAIYEDQQRGVAPSILQPRMQALANLLRTIQAFDPRYELVSVGEMSITILNAQRQMPRTPVPPYTMLDPVLRPEYVRQLRDQEDGLNSFVAAQWQQQRARFLTTGRTREERAMRREFQRRSGHEAGTAAPHNPDQGLSGHIDPTGPPAVSAVNSHIGSQNPGKIPSIEAALNAISPAAKLVTQLNLELSVV